VSNCKLRLAASGAEVPTIMQAGRWKSPAMPARYAERAPAGRGASPGSMRDAMDRTFWHLGQRQEKRLLHYDRACEFLQ
jgi:hypothetical protein